MPEISPDESRRRAGIDRATRRALLYGVMPVWMGAGLADWWHHRRTRIERTSGIRESAIHALMMTEAATPTMLGLFREVNAGVLGVAAGSVAAHQATAYADVAYAQPRREVTPGEQQVHSLLEVVPMAATALLTVLHWDQAAALAGRGGRADLRLRPKRNPLSRRAQIATLGAVGLCCVLPYAEEMLRCLRVRPERAAEFEAQRSSERDSQRKVETMRWGRRARRRQEPQAAPDTADTAETDALQEARKGTAAAHPALVVTPDKKAHSGAFVDGRFVEARESSYTRRPRRSAEQHEREVAEGEVPGENEAMKDKWWVPRVSSPSRGSDEEESR
jgi:hypothetical protein